MNRRGFLGALARTPVVGAIAGRKLAEEAAGKLAGVSLTGLSGGGIPAASDSAPPTQEQWSMALRFPAVRAQLEELLYEEQRQVYAIDPDIAVVRSFSLNAKIAFQRQRNVAKRIEMMQNGYSWSRIGDVIFRALGLRL